MAGIPADVVIAAASAITTSEQPCGYLICTSPSLLKKAVIIKAIVDQAVQEKTPVFVMGNVDELEVLWETLSPQMLKDVFTRPINLGDVVENIHHQIEDFYDAKKRTILKSTGPDFIRL